MTKPLARPMPYKVEWLNAEGELRSTTTYSGQVAEFLFEQEKEHGHDPVLSLGGMVLAGEASEALEVKQAEAERKSEAAKEEPGRYPVMPLLTCHRPRKRDPQPLRRVKLRPFRTNLTDVSAAEANRRRILDMRADEILPGRIQSADAEGVLQRQEGAA